MESYVVPGPNAACSGDAASYASSYDASDSIDVVGTDWGAVLGAAGEA